MDRFSAYLLVRRFLRRPASRNRALAVESVMEELATLAPDAQSWGVLGLLSQLDLEYAEHNPRALGLAARDQAVLEGMAPELAESLARWRQPAAEAPALESALLLADWLVTRTLCPPPAEAASTASGADRPDWLEPPLARGIDDEEAGPGDREEAPPAPLLLPSLDEPLARRLGGELEAARTAGGPQGEGLDQALHRLGLSSPQLVQLGLRGLGRVAADLR